MKRILFGMLASAMALVPFVQNVNAAESNLVQNTSHALISQAFFGSKTDASDEFIVIINTSSETLDISGYTIEYKAATGKSWYEKARVGDGVLISAGQQYIFATKRERDAEMTSGFAQKDGNLRLIDAKGGILDAVAWGAGDAPEGVATVALSPGNELSRKIDSNGVGVDTGDNSNDFEVVSLETSLANNTEGVVSPTTLTIDTVAAVDVSIEITELLPDPKNPASDSSDEFIELYNAGSEAVSLAGWKLQDAAGHSAKLDGTVLAPGQYKALMSAQTKLSLNNSGDTISLLDPSGSVVMETPNYVDAKEGLSFGVTVEGWGWLASVTPNAVNTALAKEDVVAAASSKTKSKKDSAKSAKKKATSAKTKTPKLAKTASASVSNGASDPVDAQTQTVPWVWLVAGLGVLALGYGIYEYRPEITSFITKLRAKFSARS
ncbi:lamin tail domain-containing protein [bacterium]|nr:MAG: lamin tail domain-containing protein [bacterium]